MKKSNKTKEIIKRAEYFLNNCRDNGSFKTFYVNEEDASGEVPYIVIKFIVFYDYNDKVLVLKNGIYPNDTIDENAFSIYKSVYQKIVGSQI